MADICLTSHNIFSSRNSSIAGARRPSSERAKMWTPDQQAQKPAQPGANQRSGTPGPTTRVIHKDGSPSALLASQPAAHQETAPAPNPKNQCFHAMLPIKNNLKVLKVPTWAQKMESPQQWLHKGSTVLAVCDMAAQKGWCSSLSPTNWA